MARHACRYAAATLLLAACATEEAPRDIRHFVFFGRDRERIAEAGFLAEPAVAGAQLTYAWRELEPERDRYDLSPVLDDLALLERHGKRLFLQLQDVSFDTAIVNVPRYLRTDSAFHGGVAMQVGFPDDGGPPVPEGWVARRWDPAVRARFTRLLAVLADSLDGRIEGINFPETIIEFGSAPAGWPAGFTPAGYADAVRATLTAAATAFRSSVVLQYANFMPGESLPEDDRGYLRGVYRLADSLGIGVGGPDLLPGRPYQRRHSLALLPRRAPGTPGGVAVQWGNLADRDPHTGAPVTVDRLFAYARDTLRVDYIFWGTQEPYYSRDILPFLRRRPAP